jgi:RNA polymerase sigma factor (sigma-70 family)
MAGGQLRAVISELRRLIGGRGGCTLTDAQLLEDFVTRGDQASFEVLVWRHGTMVLSLCQRVLRDTHEAEDAFQATFLVFARKAGSIARRAAVGSWLYKVAYRVALRVRARAERRGAWEEAADDLPAHPTADEVLWRDLRPVLDEEIDRLPEKYRAPFVLCYLQGHTNEEAAEQLGCPKGTILSRLARGRQRLRSRLARRGLAPSAAAVATSLSQNAAPAAVPAALMSSTVKAAVPFAAGKVAAGLVSASVAALTEGVLQAMFLTKLKIATAALLALAVLGTGAGLFGHRVLAQRPAAGGQGPAAERAAQKAAAQAAREDVKAPQVAGKVVAVAKDGKSFTLEIPARGRGDDAQEAKKIDVKIGDKTVVTYHGVGPDAARPTEGYGARVRLQDGAKDVAAGVTFQGSVNVRSPDVAGKVIGVAKDGNGINLELPAPRPREEEPKKMEIKFNVKTILSYSQVAKGGAKLTEGYDAQVWLVDGLKDGTAASVQLIGKEQGRLRRAPDVAGKVSAVAKDGKSITLEMPPQGRGEEPKKVDVKLGDKTEVVYFGVDPDGTKVAEGFQASVWLEEGSKDSAAHVILRGVVRERWSLVAGQVVGVAKDGKGFTVELPGQGREAPKRVDIKITDKTRVAYEGVGPDGAKPTEGYAAQVRLVDESKDTAALILFATRGGGRRR